MLIRCSCLVLFVSLLIFSNGEPCSPEGQEFNTNDVYYKCTDGNLVPFACASESGKKVMIGETYETVGYEMKCTQLSANWVQPVPVACMQNGKRLALGDTFIDHTFWYTCVQKNNQTISIELSGCVDNTGAKVGPGQNFHTGNFVFRCVRLPTGGITVQPVACIYNGKEIPVGEEAVDESFYFRCDQQGDSGIQQAPVGCSHQGKKIEVDQKYTRDGFVFKCEKTATGVSHTVVGCIGADNKEYFTNDRWTEGEAPYRFVLECSRDGEKIMKRIVQCSYDGPEGQAVIDPGCMKKVKNVFVHCLRKGSNGVEYRVSLNSTTIDGDKLC